MLRIPASAVVVAAALRAGAAAQCCIDESTIDMVPAAWIERAARHANQREARATFTPVPVDIDPLGAVGDVPWVVHYASLNIRSGPTTTSSVLGSLSANAQRTAEYFVVLETDEEWLRIQHNGGDAWIARAGVRRVHPANEANIAAHGNLPVGEELVNRWWGNPLTYEATDLVTVPSGYTNQIAGRTYLLRAEVAAAALAMIDASRADGVDMRVASPYRSGPQQKQIYDAAVSADGLAQRYSAPPGHSEHQLGTTFDISSPATGDFIDNGSPQHDWLLLHAAEFGFRQSYTADSVEETGYIEEPWHWRWWGTAPPPSGGDLWSMQ